MVETEDDVLHTQKLPSFNGRLSQKESEVISFNSSFDKVFYQQLFNFKVIISFY